jgi:hypothetical protein
MRFSSLVFLGVASAGLTASTPMAAKVSPEVGARALGSKPGCTENSQSLKSMMLKDWSVVHAPSPDGHLRGTFTIYNPGPDQEYKIRNIPYNDDGDWHVAIGFPKELVGMQYCYNMTTNDFNFQLQWKCDDKPPLVPAEAHGDRDFANII